MQHTIPLRGKWLARLCIGYVLLIAFWLALRAARFDRLWWLALLNTFALALFLPLAVLLPLALWPGRRRLLAALALPLVAFGWRTRRSSSPSRRGWARTAPPTTSPSSPASPGASPAITQRCSRAFNKYECLF